MADMPSSPAGQDGAVVTGEGPRASRPRRRTFTADYKMRILAQYEQLDDPRERGALLRREGLYTSHISEWRKARDKGAEKGLAEKPAGRPGVHSRGAVNWCQLRAGSGGSQGVPSVAARMASRAVMPWAAAESM